MPFFKLQTPRLELVAPPYRVAKSEIEDLRRFEAAMSARLADGWPPPLVNREAQLKFLSYLETDPEATPWEAWYFILRDERLVVGNGGFKGRPDARGMVEVGYSMVETHQGFGLCTEAVGALIAWAFSHATVERVDAETFPDNKASLRVMEKNGLVYLREGEEQNTVRYALTRQRFELR